MKLIKTLAMSALAFSSFNAMAGTLNHNIRVTANAAQVCTVNAGSDDLVQFLIPTTSSPPVQIQSIDFSIDCNSSGLGPQLNVQSNATWSAPAAAVAGLTVNGALIGMTTNQTFGTPTTSPTTGISNYALTGAEVRFGSAINAGAFTAPSNAAGAYQQQPIVLTVSF
jgi:hypothetical protein